MSSILKALKKLENDRSQSKPIHQRIDDEILRDGSSARLSRTAVVFIAIALFVCGSVATYVYMKRTVTDEVARQSTLSRTESGSQPQNRVSTPPVLAPTIASPRLSQKTTAIPGLQDPLPKAKDPAKISNANEPVKPAEIAPEIDSKPVAAPSPAPTQKGVVSRPILTINGIAFQDGGSENLAVINGITVSSGTLIEGVMVEDIQKDRVRFSQGGEKFEIILNKTSR